MKFAPWVFSMAVSAASGTFAVTSWAVEGISTPATTSAKPTSIGHAASNPQGTDRVASDEVDYVGGQKRRGVKEDDSISDSLVASCNETKAKHPSEFHR